MSQCNRCTSKCGTCVGERSSMFCNKLDPLHKTYNPAYGDVINNMSCSANTGVPVVPDISPAKPVMPSLVDQAKGFVTSMFDYAKSGFQNVTKEVYDERLSICRQCEFFGDNGRCQKCNCVMVHKCHLATAECPVKRWLRVNPDTSPHEVTDTPDFSEHNTKSTIVPCQTCGKEST